MLNEWVECKGTRTLSSSGPSELKTVSQPSGMISVITCEQSLAQQHSLQDRKKDERRWS